KVRIRIAPLPLRDDNVARDALRTVGFSERKFARSDAIGPVSEQLERASRAEPADVARHEQRSAACLQPARPGGSRILEGAKSLTDRPGAGRSQRMTGLAGAAVRLRNFPGTVWTVLESIRPYPRTQTL